LGRGAHGKGEKSRQERNEHRPLPRTGGLSGLVVQTQSAFFKIGQTHIRHEGSAVLRGQSRGNEDGKRDVR
jgi:hypothetical protein